MNRVNIRPCRYAKGITWTARWELSNRPPTVRSFSKQSTTDNAQSPGALTGLKILDISRVLAAPFCTQILADYGADVIKVETVGKGDDTRHWMMPGETEKWKKAAGPMSNYFSAVNRNKRSITLDLKQREGKEILKKLAGNTDVLIENFKPGTMDRLGLGYESLQKENPRLIYASISGYGTTGPYANRGGYDPIAAAEAGLLHITGERDGPPVRTGIGMVDMATGLYLHGAILAAVYARDRDGTGQRVDTSLFEAQLSLLTNVGLSWLNLGIEAQRWGCQHPSIAPYDAFQTKDAYLVCGATNDAQFAALCKLLGLEDLITDDRFATNPKRVENRHLLGPIFNQVFLTRTTKEWVSVFDKTGLPFGPINNMERAFEHSQTVARDMISHVRLDAAESGEIRLIGPAVKFSRTRTSLQRAPPRLGEHTSDLLEELGIEKQEAANLKKKGVI
ncbi:hypothetical protein QWA68_013549 [Fusarium oxysporum]|nr:hypothetical protein QWA68_013549 [Fusarium oxysporum]